MTISSKVIAGGGKEKVEQWSPPNMRGTEVDISELEREAGPVLTAEQLEQIQKAAYDEGFAQGNKAGFEYGHKEALAQGRAELAQTVVRFEQLMNLLERPLQQLDDQVERELIEMVIAMVRQLVRREVRTDPEQIIGVVREALSILPVSSRGIRVVLHPEDATLVRRIYELSENELGWKIIEDPVVARGGCRILTDTSQVDATLESRLASLIAPLLGDERDQSEA
ncbi:MAG: flagellar assembly protein FliH [Gammaproteobacteria bacterium]|nr:flagellar assembly protein FliH [Gammaproteobacteria bacterium]MCB1881230.1 flagellar assembly protein FliH [Gammaproteobacteria bacterium]MCB1904487.1 flagellar assembly protein FliH [Gammaproteobacteria bacterium]